MDIPHELLKAAGKTLFRRTSQSPQPDRILVLKSASFRDFLNAMPALYVLRKTFRDARIVLLALPWSGDAHADWTADTGYQKLLDDGVVDQTIEPGLRELAGLGGMVRLRQRMRALDCDMTFVIPSTVQSRIGVLKKLAFLRALGVGRNVYGWMAGAESMKEDGVHQIFGPLAALKEAGIGFDAERDIVFPVRRDKAASDYVGSLWKRHGLTGRDTVAVFPGGRFEHKRWPVERFSRLVRALLDRDAGVVLIGGGEERFLCERLSRSVSGRAKNLAGRLDHLAMAEALRRSALFIGNDSAHGHLASAVGTPCITITSSADTPGMREPWHGRGLAVREPVDCEHCRSEFICPAGTNECINKISVERVFDLAGWRLAQNSGRGELAGSVNQ